MRIVTIGLAIGLALAAPTLGKAAIYSPEQQLPGPTIAEFKTNPDSLLKSYPNGGTDLSTRIRDILATDPTTLAAIVNLLKAANGDSQMRGVVTGLAQAALLARQTTQNAPFGTEITDAVVAANNKPAYDLYAQLIGDAPIGAGAGGGGGGGSGGGGPNSSSGIVTGGASTTPQAAPATSRANTAAGSGSVGFSAATTGASAVTSATQ